MKKITDIKNLKVPCGGKLVYMLLQANVNRKSEVSTSVKAISRVLGISPPTVTRNIKRLRRLGLIYVQPQYKENGMREVNVYHLKDLS